MSITTTVIDDTIYLTDDAGFRTALTAREAGALRDTLKRVVAEVMLKADPYYGKHLRITIRGGVTVNEIMGWRARIDEDRSCPIFVYAVYVLEDLGPQIADCDIAEILAWGEANPGHPFAFTLIDEPDPDEMPF